MYILVLTRKKRLNLLLITLISFIVLAGGFQLFRLLSPETEIVLDQRLSFLLPLSTRLSSVYMTDLSSPTTEEAGALLGKKWKTEKIHQLEMSEISFKYPEMLRMDEIKNLGQEISIHINYQHTNNKVFGFFQVWNLKQSLKEFLMFSKKHSSLTFIHFEESSIKAEDLRGVLWEYTFMTKTEDIIGLEAFLENGEEMYRFSMYVPKEDFKPAYKGIFLRMVQSLRVKGTGALPNVSYVGLDKTFYFIRLATLTQFFPLRFAI